MWINPLTYGPIEGGRNDGILAVQVDLTGETPDGNTDEVARTIFEVNKLQKDGKIGRSKVINLSGTFTQENSPFVLTALEVWRKHNWEIVVNSDGQIYHPWFIWANFITVNITREPWAGFNCNEVRFHVDGDEIFDPILPADLKKSSVSLFIVPGKDTKLSKVMDFIKGSEYPWNLLIPHKGYKEEL